MISTKAKVFTLPDGSASDQPLRCIILDFAAANTYFEGVYNPKDIKPPACFALGRVIADMAPSDNSPAKQNSTCTGCPKFEWGSDPQGGKGKACKNTRRVVVVPTNATEKTQPWVLSVSPTALKFFDKYVNSLSDMGTHPIEVITEISFAPEEAYPSLRFEVIDKHDSLDVAWALKEQAQDILFQEPKIEKAA